MSSLKYLVYLLLLSLTSSGCDQELVKWEFLARPQMIEEGSFAQSTFDLQQSVNHQDILDLLNLSKGVELHSVKLNGAAVSVTLDNIIKQPDSVYFEIHSNAFPSGISHYGVLDLTEESTHDGGPKKIKIYGASPKAVEAINEALERMLHNGPEIRFRLTGRSVPSGSLVSGELSLLVLLDVVYWECVEVPEFAMLSDANKGPCQ